MVCKGRKFSFRQCKRRNNCRKEDPTVTTRTGYVIHINPSTPIKWANSVGINCFDSSGNRINVNSLVFGDMSNYNDRAWHNVVGICDIDNNGKARLYIDGAFIGESEETLISNIGTNDLPVIIGGRDIEPRQNMRNICKSKDMLQKH